MIEVAVVEVVVIVVVVGGRAGVTEEVVVAAGNLTSSRVSACPWRILAGRCYLQL
jgi:hypothetical protein